MNKRKTAAETYEATLERLDDIALAQLVSEREHESTIKAGLDELLGPDEMRQAIPRPICHSERSEES